MSLCIVEPANGCVTFGHLLQLEIESCEVPFVDYSYDVYLNNVNIPVVWRNLPWKNRKFCELPKNLNVGSHTIKVVKTSAICRDEDETSFLISNYLTAVVSISKKLMAAVKRNNPPNKLAWDWSEGLFLEGCVRLEKVIHNDLTYVSTYAIDYHNVWQERGIPTINKSDSCVSGLSATSLLDVGNISGYSSLKQISSYIDVAPRNSAGTLNHLGNACINWFYPRSIWVDSLMMYGVLAVRFGAKDDNQKLLNFGLEQVEIFSDKLQDPTVSLWRHAWLEQFNHTIPETETYWLRGNGWALASIAEMMDYVPPTSQRRLRFLEIFTKTLDSLLLLQQDNGLWDSVANIPGYTYPETSGSLLVAYAIARGVKNGWLDTKYLDVVYRVINSISSRIAYDKNYPDIIALHGISGPTNAGPRWLYGTIEEEENALYGVGIYFMLCAELLLLERDRLTDMSDYYVNF